MLDVWHVRCPCCTICTTLCHKLHFLPQELGCPSMHCTPGRGGAASPLAPHLKLADLALERETELPVPFSIHAGRAVPKLRKHSSCQRHTNPPPPGKAPPKGSPCPPPGRPASPATTDRRREGMDSLPPSHRTLPPSEGSSPGEEASPAPEQPPAPEPPALSSARPGPARTEPSPGPARRPPPSPAQPRPGRGPHPVRADSRRTPAPRGYSPCWTWRRAALRPARRRERSGAARGGLGAAAGARPLARRCGGSGFR